MRRGVQSPQVATDAQLAASLQAEVWQDPSSSDAQVARRLQTAAWQEVDPVSPARHSADAEVAASLQAEIWQESTSTPLSDQIWQLCSQLVAQHCSAKPQIVKTPNSRPKSAPMPVEEMVTLEENQLQWKLSDFGLCCKPITGDGACQFRAVADQLYGDQNLHAAVRANVIEQLKANPNHYEGFAVGESFNEYVNRMADAHTWGDNLTLQAIADLYGIRVCIISTFLEKSFLCIAPLKGQVKQHIWLGFFAEFHYTSLIPLK